MRMYEKIRRFRAKILQKGSQRQINYVGVNFIKILKMIN